MLSALLQSSVWSQVMQRAESGTIWPIEELPLSAQLQALGTAAGSTPKRAKRVIVIAYRVPYLLALFCASGRLRASTSISL